jgi:hypothetical protein
MNISTAEIVISELSSTIISSTAHKPAFTFPEDDFTHPIYASISMQLFLNLARNILFPWFLTLNLPFTLEI